LGTPRKIKNFYNGLFDSLKVDVLQHGIRITRDDKQTGELVIKIPFKGYFNVTGLCDYLEISYPTFVKYSKESKLAPDIELKDGTLLYNTSKADEIRNSLIDKIRTSKIKDDRIDLSNMLSSKDKKIVLFFKEYEGGFASIKKLCDDTNLPEAEVKKRIDFLVKKNILEHVMDDAYRYKGEYN